MIIASIKNKTINSLANKPDNTKMTKADAKNAGSNHTDGAAIMFVCKMAVDISRLDDFKSHARKAIKDIKSTESNGTRSFKFYFSGCEGHDHTRCHTVEHYRDSSAAIVHLRNMQKNVHRNAAITKFGMITVLEVHGPASEELVSVLNDEDYSVEYYESSDTSLCIENQ